MKINRQTKLPSCKQCKYYFGENSIQCAVHPSGKESQYCPDWQKANIMQQLVDMGKSQLKNFTYAKAIVIAAVIICPIFSGYKLYQTVPAYIESNRSYEQYTQHCEVFLTRAGRSGTTGIAQRELTLAVNWLEVYDSNQSFEFDNLQANLNYLQKQPSDSLLPVVIKDSINQSALVIKHREVEQRNAKLFDLCSVGLAIALLLILGSRLIVVFPRR
jgi:hypothetical protein